MTGQASGVAVAKESTPGAAACADRKRQRRCLQNTLVSALDRALPDQARRKAFKGAGSRSAGIRGRSVFNVLTDVIGYIKAMHLQAACALASKHALSQQSRFIAGRRHDETASPLGGEQMERKDGADSNGPDRCSIAAAASVLESLQRHRECLLRKPQYAVSERPLLNTVSRSALAHSEGETEPESGSSAADNVGQSPVQKRDRGGTELWSRSVSPQGTSWQWQRIWVDPRGTTMPPPRLLNPDRVVDSSYSTQNLAFPASASERGAVQAITMQKKETQAPQVLGQSSIPGLSCLLHAPLSRTGSGATPDVCARHSGLLGLSHGSTAQGGSPPHLSPAFDPYRSRCAGRAPLQQTQVLGMLGGKDSSAPTYPPGAFSVPVSASEGLELSALLNAASHGHATGQPQNIAHPHVHPFSAAPEQTPEIFSLLMRPSVRPQG